MSAASSLRICLLASTELDRCAFRLLLRDELQASPVSDGGYPPVMVWAAMRAGPELVIAFVDRPTPEIRDALQMIPRLRSTTRVLVVGPIVEVAALRVWSQCRLDGYVIKDGGVAELRAAIDAIAVGGSHFSNGLREELSDARKGDGKKRILSRREAELLPLLANGMTLREAAAAMTVSYKTADSYRTNLLRKLGVHDRVELAKYAIRERIIDP